MRRELKGGISVGNNITMVKNVLEALVRSNRGTYRAPISRLSSFIMRFFVSIQDFA